LSHVLLGQIDKNLGICEPRHVQMGYHAKLPTLVKTSAKMASTNWECPMVPEQIQSVFPVAVVTARNMLGSRKHCMKVKLHNARHVWEIASSSERGRPQE